MKKESTNERIIELLESLRSELKDHTAELINGLRSELKDHTAGLINGLRSELRSELKETRMELLQHIDAIHENLAAFQQETRVAMRDLQDGAFTKEERDDVLAMARHYDRWLEEDTLGKNRITLKRSEYDKASLAERFPNRFEEAIA